MYLVTRLDLYSLMSSEYHDVLAESAAKIAIHNFKWSFTTLVLFNSTLVSGVDLFLKLYKQPQYVGNGKFYPSFAQRTKQYILFGTNISNIELMIQWMAIHKFDNTGNYIVTCQSQDCDENQAVEVFWNHKITNVVFMKLLADGEIVGYTYFYPDEYCLPSPPVKTNVCIDDASPCIGIFPKKVKYLRNCSITVSTFNQLPYMNITNGKPHGYDGELLLLIAKGLNTNLKMMTPRIGDGWGICDANGTWSGSLADLLDDAANFSMTSPALTLSRYSQFQMSIPYYAVTVGWITHPAPKKPASLNLFHPFETLSQIVLGVCFLIVSFCAWLVNSNYWPLFKNKNNRSSGSRPSALFYSWMLCMGLPSTKLPTQPAYLYMVFLWIWYCFLIRTFYQVYLISSLQGNFYYDELSSIEEAFDKKYALCGNPALKEYYINHPLIYENWNSVDASNIVPTLLKLATNPKIVLAMNLQTAKTVIKDRKLYVYILPQKVVNSPTVIFFKKFSPLADSINILLRRLIESGFTNKIYGRKAIKNGPQDEDDHTPITLEHYTGCYFILLTGWMFSTVLFIIELIYGKLLKTKRKCVRGKRKKRRKR